MPDTTKPDPDVAACAAAVIDTVPLVMRAIRVYMRSQTDLSVPQFRALGYIRRHPETSLSAVAEHLGLSVPAVSRLIDGLVTQGLVERPQSAHDRRYVALNLSSDGAAMLTTAQAGALAQLEAILAPLTPAERTAVCDGLAALRALFATLPAGAPPVAPERNL